MAIDTAKKRKSIAAIGARYIGPVVIPDGTIDTQDRRIIGYSYPIDAPTPTTRRVIVVS